MQYFSHYTKIIFDTITLEVVMVAIALALLINLVLTLRVLTKQQKNRTTESPTVSFDTKKLDELQNKLTEFVSKQNAQEVLLQELSDKLPRTALVRYNPFRDSGVGGNQSFSLAHVNSQGAGFIITHLFSREMSRVQSKEIKAWKSETELSPEEQQALDTLKS